MSGKVCIVCLKTFQNVQNESTPQGVSLLTKFLKFTQNYLKISPSPIFQQLITVDEPSRDSFCEKCELAVINPICKVYLELTSAQLRLSWELEHLEKLLENSNRNSLAESGVGNIKLLADQLGIDSVSDLEGFRSLLAQKCQLKRKLVLPQVLIGSRCDAQETALLELKTVYEDCEQVLEDPLAFDGTATDPLELNCDNSEENVGLEKIIKLEEFHVDNDEKRLAELEVESVSSNLPFTSSSLLFHLVDQPPPPKKVNFLNGEIECPTCGKILQNNAMFELHDRYYHRPTICTLCGKTFKGSNTLRSHTRRTHKHKVTFPCRVCAKVFSSTASLSIHMRSYHKPDQLRYSCSYSGCTASFHEKSNLDQHVAAIHKPGSEM